MTLIERDQQDCGNCIHWFYRNGPMGICAERSMPKVSSQWCGRWQHYSPNADIFVKGSDHDAD